MKVFVSFDMEGIAGIVDWQQCIGDGPAYQLGQHLTLGEVNAAIDGAVQAGADEVVVNDAYWTMHNLPPHELNGNAAYIAGRHKPLYMMQGLDSSFDACLFVGYHGSISGEPAVLSHTYNPTAISHVELNGTRVGESGINALVARAAGVPVALVSGDRQTAEEAKAFLPGAELVIVKESFTRFAAHNLHPERARQLLREGARRAVRRAGSLAPPAIDLPARLEVWLQTADMAEMAGQATARPGGRAPAPARPAGPARPPRSPPAQARSCGRPHHQPRDHARAGEDAKLPRGQSGQQPVLPLHVHRDPRSAHQPPPITRCTAPNVRTTRTDLTSRTSVLRRPP
jgi:D-amino peptidase